MFEYSRNRKYLVIYEYSTFHRNIQHAFMVMAAVVTNVFDACVRNLRKQPRKNTNVISRRKKEMIAYVHRNTKHLFELWRLFSQVIYLMCLHGNLYLCICVCACEYNASYIWHSILCLYMYLIIMNFVPFFMCAHTHTHLCSCMFLFLYP